MRPEPLPEDARGECDDSAYSAIATGAAVTIQCLAAWLGEARNETDARIERLLALGLVERHGSRLVARQPGVVLQDHIDVQDQILSVILAQRERNRLLASLSATPRDAPASVEWCTAVDGDAAASQLITRLLDGALTSVELVVDEFVASHWISLLREPVDASKRVVRVRALVEDWVAGASAGALLLQQKQGGLDVELRMTPTLPLGMLLVDGSTVLLLHAGPDSVSVQGVAVRAPRIIQSLCLLFDGMWTAATGLALRTENGLTVQQQQVLALLASGHTDSAIAHALDVSKRTVTRVVSELLANSSARSRFELGCKATLNGWVGTLPANLPVVSDPTAPLPTATPALPLAPLPTGQPSVQVRPCAGI